MNIPDLLQNILAIYHQSSSTNLEIIKEEKKLLRVSEATKYFSF
jgi:hypothetical protein